MKVKEILSYMEQRFPYELAYDFDYNKIGLTIGNENNELNGILFALDLTSEVIDEAIKKNCNLIISHHPFTFSPITKVVYTEEKGELIYKMVKNDLSLIAMHTNMDLGNDGVADSLCNLLKLKNSNAYVCKKDELIRVGVIEEVTLKQLSEDIKNIFNLSGVKVVGDLNKKINKIGIIGGSGGHESDIDDAIKFGCQCYITGEIKHHIALYAKHKDICLIEVDHGIEKVVFDKLSKDINEKFNVLTFVSKISSNLFKFI